MGNLARVRALLRNVTPPVLHRALRSVLPPSGDWRYEPDGWRDGAGWDSPSVARLQAARWPSFLAEIAGTGPLAAAHERLEAGVVDPSVHNTIMSFGYVLARAAHMQAHLSILDWGGGLGPYHAIARVLMPEIVFEYTSKDLPNIVHAGRTLQPTVRFVDSDSEAFDRTYTLVMASSSLQYSRDWRHVARQLAEASDEFLYITRLPVVHSVPSFVVSQRAYGTEWPGWFINRNDLIEVVTAAGMRFERGFLVDERPTVPGAPEQTSYEGFLFRRASPRR